MGVVVISFILLAGLVMGFAAFLLFTKWQAKQEKAKMEDGLKNEFRTMAEDVFKSNQENF